MGQHRKRPGNATAASHERPQVPGTNDFKDFVVEMQKTITDLREQVTAWHVLSHIADGTVATVTAWACHWSALTWSFQGHHFLLGPLCGLSPAQPLWAALRIPTAGGLML